MEAEAVKTLFYLLLVLGGGVMVGVLAILFVISIATFGAAGFFGWCLVSETGRRGWGFCVTLRLHDALFTNVDRG
jgi:hypothetical protein